MDDQVDGIATYRAHPNVVLFRTFSKAYGLAGFRVGYAVAQEPVAAAVRAVSLPFGVSGVAQAAAVASLDAEAELLERVDALVAERDRVRDGLREAGLGRARAAGQLRLVRARRPDRRRSRPRPTRSASWSGRSPARASGSRSARPRPTTGCSSWRGPSRTDGGQAGAGIEKPVKAAGHPEAEVDDAADPAKPKAPDRAAQASRRGCPRAGAGAVAQHRQQCEGRCRAGGSARGTWPPAGVDELRQESQEEDRDLRVGQLARAAVQEQPRPSGRHAGDAASTGSSSLRTPR